MDGLTFEGLLAQARRVAVARWPALLIVAALWGLAAWGVIQAATALIYGPISDLGLGDGLFALLMPLPGLIGMAVMISLIVRVDLPRRSPGAIAGHAAVATLTLLVLGVYGAVIGWLVWMSNASGLMESWMGYPLAFLPAAIRYGLFAFFGMMLPAALERTVNPIKAASVSLLLTRGRRLWLALIALVWTIGLSAPVYGLMLALGGRQAWFTPLAPLGGMLGAFGLGVLYLELRRLHTADLATRVEPGE